MRYRRVTTRYLRLVPMRQSLPYGDVLRALTPVPQAPRRWRPAADVCETQAEVVVVLDLAGLDEEAVDIGLYEDALVVEGDRRLDACAADGLYHAAEIRQGPFRVEVGLPPGIDPERVEATYDRGILRVRLGKRRAAGTG